MLGLVAKIVKRYIPLINEELRKYNNNHKAVHMAKGAQIGADVWIDRPELIYVGENSLINTGCLLRIGYDEGGEIHIGRNVQIGCRSSLICVTHEVGTPDQRAGKLVYKPIKIGNGCWIGANCTVLPGVTIGDGTVIAAGAVVTNDCVPNCLYAGVPAKLIKELEF